jgi:hypothetical protein
MQLSHASVDSFADGVLTLTFAQAGIEKGFLTGGYDKDLSQVLSALYGITPHIRTAVAPNGDSGQRPDNGIRPSGSQPARQNGPSGAQRAAAGAASQSRAGARAQEPGASSRPGPQAGRGRPAGGVPSGADAEPEPGDPAAPETLTGTDLIERELGGRVIEEIEGP